MRKLLALPAFLSVSLAGVMAQAAPAGPKCTPISDYEKVKEKNAAGTEVEVFKVDNGVYAKKGGGEVIFENCWADEVFVLDGDQKITVTTTTPGVMGMAPTTTTSEVDLVECKAADGKDCVI